MALLFSLSLLRSQQVGIFYRLILGCQSFFIDRTSGPISALSAKSYLDTGFDLRDECLRNNSALSAVSNLGLLNASQANITSQIIEKLDDVDFSVISSWNSRYFILSIVNRSDSIDLSESPESRVSGLTSVNTTQLNTTSLEDAVNTRIPSLVVKLTALKNNIELAYSSATVSDLDFNPGGSGSTVQDVGLNAYKSKLSSINRNISALIGLLNVQINETAILLATQIQIIKGDTTATIVFFQIIYQNRMRRKLSKNYTII